MTTTDTTLKSTKKNIKEHQKSATRWTQIPELTDSDTLEHLLKMYATINNVSIHLRCTRYQVMNAMKAHGIGRHKVSVPAEMKKKLRI